MDKWTKGKCAGIVKSAAQGKVTKVQELVSQCMSRKIKSEIVAMQRRVGKEFS